MDKDTLEKRIKELAEQFCDNPNYQDIEDALREFAEGISRQDMKTNLSDYLKQTNEPGEHCPICGAKEVDANTPRTVYACGSSDYDQRPRTLKQGDNCKGSPK